MKFFLVKNNIFILLLFVLGQICFAPPSSIAQDMRESTAKINFIHGLSDYMFWPEEPKVITYCTKGRDAVSNGLKRFLDSKNNKKYKVINNITYPRMNECDMLWISREEEANLSRILDMVQGSPVFTISDIKSFAKRGGMVEFFLVETGKSEYVVRLSVNLKNVKKANIGMSSDLLDVVKVVDY